MNQVLLQDSARVLEGLLLVYAAADEEAARFYSAMKNHLADAQSGRMVAPLEAGVLPGSIYFNEGSLRKYADLELAYANFAMEARGGETPAFRAFKHNTSGG